jgi:hypothetical protein
MRKVPRATLFDKEEKEYRILVEKREEKRLFAAPVSGSIILK